MEKPLDDIKGNIVKVQVAFENEFPSDLDDKLEILHKTKTGSVYSLIVKGTDVKEKIEEFSPLICDIVSLTLEEVFIYELGGLGYDFESILL